MSTPSTPNAPWCWDPRYREWCYWSHTEQYWVYPKSGGRLSAADVAARAPELRLTSHTELQQRSAASGLVTQPVQQSTVQANSYANNVERITNLMGAAQMNAVASTTMNMPVNNVAAVRDPATGITQFVATDPVKGVQSVWLEGPATAITEPGALRSGLQSAKRFRGTEQPYEQLDPRYKVREGNRAAFFQLGRVFMVLYAEPMGQSSAQSEVTYDARYGEAFHVKPRRFVVVTPGENSCTVVAIWTYDDQGVAKRNVRKSDHAMVYTGPQPPDPRYFPTTAERAGRGEDPMKPQQIRVTPDDRAEELSDMSRINFAKVYTIEHNVKVRNIGQVHPKSTEDLASLFWLVQLENARRNGATQSGEILANIIHMRTQRNYAASQAQAQAQAQAGASSSSARRGHVPRDSVISTGSSSTGRRRLSSTTSGSRRSYHSRRSRDGERDQADVVEDDEDDRR